MVRALASLRTASTVATGLVLAWLVLAHGLVAILSRTSPEFVLQWRAEEPAALLRLAEEHLNAKSAAAPAVSGQTAAKRDLLAERRELLRSDPEITGLARRALLADPLNARAMRILGEVAAAGLEQAPDPAAQLERTASYMRAAAMLSARDAAAVEWMVRYAMATQDYTAAATYTDALLRAYPDLIGPFIGPLAGMLENKLSAPPLIAILAQNPPWRRPFVTNLPSAMSNARLPLDILLTLKKSPHPPSAHELQTYVNFLLQNKFYELSYYTWLQFLPPEQLNRAGYLFNSNFLMDPSGMPFDWTIGSGAGVNVELVANTDAEPGRLLRIVFGEGRAQFQGVSQATLLPPGRFKFRSAYKGRLAGRRGLEWRVRCAESQKPVGRGAIPVGTAATWTQIDFAFEVPAQNCRSQVLHLVIDARSTSELLIEGEIWIKRLAISRDG